jgi:hypothetical protein
MICKLPHFAPKRKHLPIARPPRALPSRKRSPAHDKNAHPIRWETCLMIRCATNNVGISQVSLRLAQGHEPEPATVQSESSQPRPPLEKSLHHLPRNNRRSRYRAKPSPVEGWRPARGECACDQKLCVIAGAITLYNTALCRVCRGSWNCVLVRSTVCSRLSGVYHSHSGRYPGISSRWRWRKSPGRDGRVGRDPVGYVVQ